MKKKLWIPMVLLIVAFIVWILMYTYPKHYKFTIQGVLYQLGEENSDFVKPDTIFVNGKMKKNIKGVRTFTGIIDIKGENIPVPEEHRQLKITLSEYGEAVLFYTYNEKGQPKHFAYGNIFVNDDFSKLTILKFTKDARNPDQSGFDGRSGYIISAPAQKRDDALEITNELIHGALKGDILK